MKFGPFIVQEKLGRGAMGVVYRAVVEEDGREVALKILTARKAASAEAKKSFRDEARIAASLRHTNIVPIHTYGELDDKVYYTMEFIDGYSLTKLIDDDVITPDDSARIAAELSDALNFAHDKGVVHSDIKPANILIDASARPLITDFGLARRRKPGEEEPLLEGQGTPAYMSPEQASGTQPVTHKTDIFSLGAVLYEMLTGRPPYEGKTGNDVMIKAAKAEFASPSRLNPYVPPDLEAITVKAMARNPDHRYASADEMGHDLRKFLRGEKVGVKGRRTMQGVEGIFKTRTGLVSLALAAAVLLPCLALFVFRKIAAPSAEELRHEKTVRYYIDAGDEYLLHRARAEAERCFTLAEEAGRDTSARILLEEARPDIDGNRKALASQYIIQGWRRLGAGEFTELDGILDRFSRISLNDSSLLVRVEKLRVAYREKKKLLAEEDRVYEKLREMAKTEKDRSVLAGAYRDYLQRFPKGRYGAEAVRGLEAIYPLYVPGIGLAAGGRRFFNEKDGADLGFVPEGSFVMGHDDAMADSRPEHEIILDGFYIYKYEVTNAQFRKFLESYGRKTDPEGRELILPEGRRFLGDKGNEGHPVVHVTWFGARAYARWAGGELPTEAQWEKAARGERGNLYPWGDYWDRDYLNSLSYWAEMDIHEPFWGAGLTAEEKNRIYLRPGTKPVGSFPRGFSLYGCYDMAGNAWEWCLDFFQADYYSEKLRSRINPCNTLDTGKRTLRGGSFLSPSRLCRSYFRLKRDPKSAGKDTGFRCIIQKSASRRKD
jgi:formylglycine-generating enzyme required for sulfatase activity/predicted Ser/Thr protein kinase